MLRLMTVLSVISLVALGCQSGGNTAALGEDADVPIDSQTATLVVHGMSCPLCANNVDVQLLRVAGVEDVEIDMGDGSVRVRFAAEQRPSRAQLARAVDRTGFTLVRIDTP